MFSSIFLKKEISCSFTENAISEKSKIAAKSGGHVVKLLLP